MHPIYSLTLVIVAWLVEDFHAVFNVIIYNFIRFIILFGMFVTSNGWIEMVACLYWQELF